MREPQKEPVKITTNYGCEANGSAIVFKFESFLIFEQFRKQLLLKIKN